MAELRKREVDRVQSERYRFPYHYIPSRYPRVTFARRWSFSPSYLAALDLFEEWLEGIVSAGGHGHVDIGCGDGALINTCDRRKFPSVTMFGIDYDERAIQWARMFGNPDEFACKPLNAIPQRSFQSASLVEVIEHIPPAELQQFVSEVADVLSAKGNLFVTVPSTEKNVTAKHYQHFDFASLERVFALHFEVVSCRGFEKSSGLSRLVQRLSETRWHYCEVFALSEYLRRQMKECHSEMAGCGRIFLSLRKK